MRRGHHPNRPVWRNEGPRHFRPRAGGPPPFRPSRGYGRPLLEAPRFPPPIPGNMPTFLVPPPNELQPAEAPLANAFHDRRFQPQPPSQRPYNKYHQPRHHYDTEGDSAPQEPRHPRDRFYVNNLGDVDHRQTFIPPQHHMQQSPWGRDNEPQMAPFDNRSHFRNYRHQEEPSETPKVPLEYVGHRPPASDHYEGSTGPAVENSESFSHSVDDTVDIIRRRLISRNDPQHRPPEPPVNQSHDVIDAANEPSRRYSQNESQEEQIPRKKCHRSKQRKSCDKIKNKIVYQLFKMDKEKMHKLLDNPNSSTKFEFAINSLINESQNTLNRQLRSAAEKSLCGPRNDIIGIDENDTIYEDTFLRQMQCILDPQDTIILEDMKPFVLAELNKVLQLDNIDYLNEQPNDDRSDSIRYPNQYPEIIGGQSVESHHYQDYNESKYFDHDKSGNHNTERSKSVMDYNIRYEKDCEKPQESKKNIQIHEHEPRSRDQSDQRRYSQEKRRGSASTDNRSESTENTLFENRSISTDSRHFDNRRNESTDNRSESTENTLFENRGVSSDSRNFDNRRNASNDNRRNASTDNRRKSTEKRLFENRSISTDSRHFYNRRNTETPLFENRNTAAEENLFEKRNSSNENYFDANAAQFSDDEDPFDELDRQYHVAVDRNFIEADDFPVTEPNVTSSSSVKTDKRPKTPVPEFYKRNTEKHRNKKENYTHRSKNRSHSKSNKNDLFSAPDKRETITADIENSIKEELFQAVESSTKDLDAILAEEFGSPKVVQEEMVSIKIENTPAAKNIIEEVQKPDSSSTPTVDQSPDKSSSRKRSTDQRPPHRKEKRKKSDTDVPESNKQILNKNIIINLNDCAGSTSEKCESNTKSVFNLYFSKDDKKSGAGAPKDIKKYDNSESTYSDKYVKRKEIPKIPKIKESKKRHNSTSSNHSTVSPKDGSTKKTPTKLESQTKFKSIDIFSDIQTPKSKPSLHQAHRNTSSATSTTSASEDKVKVIPIKSISSQVTRRHVSTQVIRKIHTRETQTSLTKSSSTRFTQTETRKRLTKAVQTEPVNVEKGTNKTTEPFERMKEIDMEIQMLVQEKFKLYNSLESKDACQGMQSLGMAVLKVGHVEEVKEEESNIANEDYLIDDFTNMPVEELEKIALETVENEDELLSKKTRRQRRQDKNRKLSENPVNKKSNKPKTPNISLLEQIITDDRPLEEIISLDDYETSPVKTKKNKKANKKSEKSKKTNFKKLLEINNIKPCTVKLFREDLSKHKMNREYIEEIIGIKDLPVEDKECEVTGAEGNELIDSDNFVTEVIGEAISNEMHFPVDMLDVSEDIVIGEVCEIDKSDDKIASETVVGSNEEIVLDNSQSEVNAGSEVIDGQQVGATCKMFDFSADELSQESVSVTGNSDAVLAIECIENNFLAAGLDGNVYYFNGEGKLLTTLRGSNLAVTCLTIVREAYGTTVYTGSLDSRIRYYDLETGLEKGPECNVLSPIQTMDRAWDTVFVGTRTGFVLQFECKNNMLIPVSTIKFSDQSILALRALKEGPRKVLLVASRSENVTIKDAQTGLLLRTLVGPKMTVYTLLYEDGKVFCGTSSNLIQVFDYASGSHIGEHEGGKGAVCLRAAGGVLFAGCYDGCVYVFRAGEPRPFAQLHGPGVMLLSLAIVGSKIIAGYKDRSLFIWKIPGAILQEMVL